MAYAFLMALSPKSINCLLVWALALPVKSELNILTPFSRVLTKGSPSFARLWVAFCCLAGFPNRPSPRNDDVVAFSLTLELKLELWSSPLTLLSQSAQARTSALPPPSGGQGLPTTGKVLPQANPCNAAFHICPTFPFTRFIFFLQSSDKSVELLILRSRPKTQRSLFITLHFTSPSHNPRRISSGIIPNIPTPYYGRTYNSSTIPSSELPSSPLHTYLCTLPSPRG